MLNTANATEFYQGKYIGIDIRFPQACSASPDEWADVNVTWTIPDAYCVASYYDDGPLDDLHPI